MTITVSLPEGRQVPVILKGSDQVATRMTTHVTVQFVGPYFLVSFFEMEPPLIMGEVDEANAEWRKVKGVEAHCVGRVAISQAQMGEVIEILQRNYQNSLAVAKQEAAAANDSQ